MDKILCLIGGVLVGFAVSMIFWKTMIFLMVRKVSSIIRIFILPNLREMRSLMRVLRDDGVKNYDDELIKIETLIVEAEKVVLQGQKITDGK